MTLKKTKTLIDICKLAGLYVVEVIESGASDYDIRIAKEQRDKIENICCKPYNRDNANNQKRGEKEC